MIKKYKQYLNESKLDIDKNDQQSVKYKIIKMTDIYDNFSIHRHNKPCDEPVDITKVLDELRKLLVNKFVKIQEYSHYYKKWTPKHKEYILVDRPGIIDIYNHKSNNFVDNRHFIRIDNILTYHDDRIIVVDYEPLKISGNFDPWGEEDWDDEKTPPENFNTDDSIEYFDDKTR